MRQKMRKYNYNCINPNRNIISNFIVQNFGDTRNTYFHSKTKKSAFGLHQKKREDF